ncbi:MAG: adenylate/guanylate cyclase domain-containing protein [Alphaproteobacteria bacterium]|nr:adenylate/guanylate cyclase domain-containing protein [Alphaproteobacteria bacterium]
MRLADPAPLEAIRLAWFDQVQRWSPRPAEPVPVRIVDIDEASLARLGQWPWPRTLLAALTRRLDQAGAAAVVFDILFAEPDRWSPEGARTLIRGTPNEAALAELVGRLPDPDGDFAAALAATRSVLGMALVGEAAGLPVETRSGLAFVGADPTPELHRFAGATRGLPVLAAAARGEGAINAVPDRDGVIRRLPLLLAVGDRAVPSLAAEALRVAQGAAGHLVRNDGDGRLLVRIGNLIVPTDRRGEAWLHYAASPDAPRLAAWRVLEEGWSAEGMRGAIVLVGSSAVGLKDLRTTPMATAVAGVDIQAEAIANMLLGVTLARPAWAPAAEIAYASLIALLLIALGAWRGLAAGAVAAAAGIAGAGVVAWTAFDGDRMLLDPTFPTLTVAAVLLVQSAILYQRTEAERRRVRTAFQHYLSPALVERLAARPDRLELGGETRTLSVLFCDIREFSRRAEALDPQALTTFVNAVMTPLSEAVLAEEGTVDKFLGDGLMAFWNAPLDEPRHAARACAAALAMVARMQAVNAALAATLPERMLPVAVGIGIGTGECCVGNFGSARRFDYSALGETVNFASRFEGLSRHYGVPVIIGEETRSAAPHLATLEIGEASIRGASRPVRIHALLGDAALAQSPSFRALRDVHEVLRAALAAGDGDAVARALAACRGVDDGRLVRLHETMAGRAGPGDGPPLRLPV